MPFQSEKQRKYLWANEPEIAREWTDKYGSKIQKAKGGRIPFANGTFGPNINQILQQNRNFMVPLSSSPYQALGTWEKEGGLQSIYDKYAEASNLSGDYVDETYNVADPYKSEGTAGDVRHVVGSSMAKDQLQNLLADYIKPGSPLAEKLTYGLGMFKTYAEELDDAIRIGKNTISGKYKGGDWDKIWSGEFLTHPREDIAMNRIGLSIPYGATEKERLRAVPSLQTTNPFEDTMMGPKTYNKEGGIWNAIKSEFGGSAQAAKIPQYGVTGQKLLSLDEKRGNPAFMEEVEGTFPYRGPTQQFSKIAEGMFDVDPSGKYKAHRTYKTPRTIGDQVYAQTLRNQDEDDPYLDRIRNRINTVSQPRGILAALRNRFYKPATRPAGGYSVAQLNRMNALGGQYSEPAREQRRQRSRVSNMLARQAAGKSYSQKNLNQLTMGSRPGHYDPPGGGGAAADTSPSTAGNNPWGR
jgi:hypothetical protein